MQGCTTTTFTCWVNTHFYIIWIGGSVATLLLIVEAVYLGRALKRVWREMRESEQWREEERNEWKALQHKIKGTIRQGEEWEVDVQPLKDLNRRLKLKRKALRLIEREKALIIVPAPVLMILAFVFAFVVTLWMLIVVGVAFLISIIWWIYHAWMWYRYRWFIRWLERAETQPNP